MSEQRMSENKTIAHGLIKTLDNKLDSIDLAFTWRLHKFEVIIKEKEHEGINIQLFDLVRNFLTKNKFEVFRISADENGCIVISAWVE
jgi:hypothetical protein